MQKQKKPRKLSLIKKEADKWFSLYIRLKYADWKGDVKCYTCDYTNNYKKGIQCGHFASRRFMNTRFDEENAKPQCFACNMYKKGNMNVYAEKLIEEHGADFIAEMNRRTVSITKVDRQWWQDKINYYKPLVLAMDNYEG